MADDTVLLASSGVGLGAAVALSLPALVRFVRQIRDRSPRTEGYEDKDGRSDEEAVKAFSTKIPKALILILSVIGLCISIAVAVLSALSPKGQGDGLFLENWLVVPGWVSESQDRLLLLLYLYVSVGTLNFSGCLHRSEPKLGRIV